MRCRFNIGDTVYVLEDNEIKAVEVLTIYIDKKGLIYSTSNTHLYPEKQLYASSEELIKALNSKYCISDSNTIISSNDHTLPLRLYHYVKSTTAVDCISKEEKSYLLSVAKDFLKQVLNSKKVNWYIKNNLKEITRIVENNEEE